MARKLAENVHVGDRFFPAGSTPPKEFADQITNPKAWGESQSSSDDSAGGYGSQSKADLQAEIDRRNEGRDEEDQIVVGGNGNKPDLVTALEEDDEAQAE